MAVVDRISSTTLRRRSTLCGQTALGVRATSLEPPRRPYLDTQLRVSQPSTQIRHFKRQIWLLKSSVCIIPQDQRDASDCGLLGDKAYLVYSTLNFQDPRAGSMWPAIYQTSHIVQLSDDYVSLIYMGKIRICINSAQLSTTKTSYNVTSAAFDLIDQQVESPDLFYRAPYYCKSPSQSSKRTY
jgi:hypothetical protein